MGQSLDPHKPRREFPPAHGAAERKKPFLFVGITGRPFCPRLGPLIVRPPRALLFSSPSTVPRPLVHLDCPSRAASVTRSLTHRPAPPPTADPQVHSVTPAPAPSGVRWYCGDEPCAFLHFLICATGSDLAVVALPPTAAGRRRQITPLPLSV